MTNPQQQYQRSATHGRGSTTSPTSVVRLPRAAAPIPGHPEQSERLPPAGKMPSMSCRPDGQGLRWMHRNYLRNANLLTECCLSDFPYRHTDVAGIPFAWEPDDWGTGVACHDEFCPATHAWTLTCCFAPSGLFWFLSASRLLRCLPARPRPIGLHGRVRPLLRRLYRSIGRAGCTFFRQAVLLHTTTPLTNGTTEISPPMAYTGQSAKWRLPSGPPIRPTGK